MQHTKLEDNYSDSNINYEIKRYNAIAETFPIGSENIKHYVRSPGRVNIISEHTDYSHFNVLPAAIKLDFVFAIGYDKTNMITDAENPIMKIHISHKEKESYSPDEVDFNLKFNEEPKTIHRFNRKFCWSSYVRAGIHAAYTVLSKDESLKIDNYTKFPKDLYIHGHGDIPLGSGLSSSSALSCASALAITSFVYEIFKPENFDHDKVMYNLAIQDPISERLVGLEGGAMDQTISLLGKRGSLLEISFSPKLHVKEIKMPSKIKIAVFNSLVDSKKVSGAKTFYNTRVAECRIAFALLLKKAGISFEKGGEVIDEEGNYRNLMGLDVLKILKIENNPLKAIDLADKYKIPDKLDLGQVCDELDCEEVVDLKRYLSMTIKDHTLIPLEPENIHDELVLAPRLRHVYSEAYREKAFVSLLENFYRAVENKEDNGIIEMMELSLGELLNESHKSLRYDYECSCKELDEVVTFSNQSCGALGSRLTGAGLGGYGVALIDEGVEDVYKSEMEHYYKVTKKVPVNDLGTAYFITEPANGASIIDYTPREPVEEPVEEIKIEPIKEEIKDENTQNEEQKLKVIDADAAEQEVCNKIFENIKL